MDVDIYGDLDNLDNQFEVIQQENELLKDTVQKLEETSIKFSIEINELKRINSNLEVNISSLFRTAKAEIERKNKQIAELRKDLDNMLFKRGPKHKSFSKNNDCKGKGSLTKQFERAQTDLKQKNIIIQCINTELETTRKELQERGNILKRNSSQYNDGNESHTAKKQKLDRETFVDNEEEYRSYKNRHEMRENRMYNSKYRKTTSRERGYNDLRSRIDLKRINYRRSRSRSREDPKYNKDPRNTHYKGTYADKPDSAEYDHSNQFQKYAADYRYAPEDGKERYYSDYSEYNCGAFNRQNTDCIFDRKLFDSPTFRNIKASDIDNACVTTVDVKYGHNFVNKQKFQELKTAKTTCNSSDKIEQNTCRDLNNTSQKETFELGDKNTAAKKSLNLASNINKVIPGNLKNQILSNVNRHSTLEKTTGSNIINNLNENISDLIDKSNTTKSDSTSNDSVKEFIISDTWDIIHRVKRNKDTSRDKQNNSTSEKNTVEKEKSKIITHNIKSEINIDKKDDIKIKKSSRKKENSKPDKNTYEKENSKSVKFETITDKDESKSEKNTNEKENLRSQKNIEKDKSEKIKKCEKSANEDSSRSKKAKEVKEITKSKEVKEIKGILKFETNKDEKDHSKSDKNIVKKNSSKTCSDSDAMKEKSSQEKTKLKFVESSKIVKSNETNNSTKNSLEDKIETITNTEVEDTNISVIPKLKLQESKTSHEDKVETVTNLDKIIAKKEEYNSNSENSILDNNLQENSDKNIIKTDDMEAEVGDTNISIVTQLRRKTSKREAKISESDSNILLVSEKQPTKTNVNETSYESSDTNILFVLSKDVSSDITKNTNIELNNCNDCITNMMDIPKQTQKLTKEINVKCSDMCTLESNVLDEKSTNEFSISLNSNSSTTLSANSPVLDIKDNNEEQTTLESANTNLNCITQNNSLELNTEFKHTEVPTQSRPTVRGRRRRCIISIT